MQLLKLFKFQHLRICLRGKPSVSKSNSFILLVFLAVNSVLNINPSAAYAPVIFLARRLLTQALSPPASGSLSRQSL